jgi:hypothetical protein
MTSFYVYEHWRPDINQCFYVGKGKGKRAFRFSHRKNYHGNIIRKLAALGMEPEVRFVATDLVEGMAFLLEKDRIAFWRRQGASLANLTDGGEGVNNPAPEVRAKMSAALRGNRRGQGKRSEEFCANVRAALANPETRQKMSASRVGKKPALGWKASEETKAKQSASRKGRRHSPEARARMSLAKKDISPETRLKMSLAQKGRKVSPEAAAKVSAANKGRKASVETRAKMSQSRTGHKQSAETIARRVAHLVGRKHSDETRARLRARHAERAAAKAAVHAVASLP